MANFDLYLCLRINFHTLSFWVLILAAGGPYWVLIFSQKNGSLLGPYLKAWGSLLILEAVVYVLVFNLIFSKMFPRGSDLHTRTQFQIHLLDMNDTIASLCEQLLSEMVEASLDCAMRSSLDCSPAKRRNSCNPPTYAAPTNINTRVDPFQPLNSSPTDAELGQEGRTKPQFRAKRPASSLLPNPNPKVSCNAREKRIHSNRAPRWQGLSVSV